MPDLPSPRCPDLTDRVRVCLARAGVGPGSRLLLGLSGGMDSAVLLDLLAALRQPIGFELAVAHVHHGLQPAADGWLAFCASRAAELGLSFHGLRVTVARDDPAGLEAAARHARHVALASIPCDWRVLAHHRDDQAETLLLRLARGTGVRGAAAMGMVEPGSPGVLRPLLDSARADIEAWARARGLAWVDDPSNADIRHARNHLRHHVLPALRRHWPAASASLARAAGHFAEATALLDELADRDRSDCRLTPEGSDEHLSRTALRALSQARLRNLLAGWLHARHILLSSSARLAEALRLLHEGPVAWRLPLGNSFLCAYRDRVWLTGAEEPAPQPVLWRGEDQLPWGAGQVTLRAAQGQGLRASMLVGGEVKLATRGPGMALRLAPGRPRRDFKHLAQEAGLPSWLRDRLPVLWLDGRVAWIGGIGMEAALAAGPGETGWLPRWSELDDAWPPGG